MRWLVGLLVPLLFVACAPETGPGTVIPNENLVLGLFDVKDLTVPIESFPGRSGFETYEQEDLVGGPFDGPTLADLIRETIDAEVWSEGSLLGFREGGILIVKAPAATSAKIGRFLAGLRSALKPRQQ